MNFDPFLIDFDLFFMEFDQFLKETFFKSGSDLINFIATIGLDSKNLDQEKKTVASTEE